MIFDIVASHAQKTPEHASRETPMQVTRRLYTSIRNYELSIFAQLTLRLLLGSGSGHGSGALALSKLHQKIDQLYKLKAGPVSPTM
jgi:hypothetical protein